MNQTLLKSNPESVYEWNTAFSNHSRQRFQQRGISRTLVCLAMDYSQAIFKQGMIFYAVKEKLLPENMDHHMREKLNNLVVIVSTESNEVLTC